MGEPKGWTKVRVRAETLARLLALARRLTEAAVKGRTAVPQTDRSCAAGKRGGVTLDAALCRALDVYEGELRRKAGRRKAGGPAPDDADPLPTGEQLSQLGEGEGAQGEEQQGTAQVLRGGQAERLFGDAREKGGAA